MGTEAKDAGEARRKRVNLGTCGEVVLHLSEDRKRLLIAFDVDAEGFDKAGLNGFIVALKKVREKMQR